MATAEAEATAAAGHLEGEDSAGDTEAAPFNYEELSTLVVNLRRENQRLRESASERTERGSSTVVSDKEHRDRLKHFAMIIKPQVVRHIGDPLFEHAEAVWKQYQEQWQLQGLRAREFIGLAFTEDALAMFQETQREHPNATPTELWDQMREKCYNDTHRDQAANELYRVQFEPTRETVTEFAVRYRKAVATYPAPLTMWEKKHKFIRKLPRELRRAANMFNGQLDELVGHLDRMIMDDGIPKETRSAARRSGETTSRKGSEGQSTVASQRTSPKRKCYRCQKEGHWKKDCPLQSGNAQGGGIQGTRELPEN